MDWLAPTIAVLAATIAFGQWWTARQKLVLDLFEKRFDVFLDVRRIASETFQLGRLQDPGMANEVLARGRFLFGKEVVAALEELRRLTIKLEVKEPSAAQQVNEHFKSIIPLFEPYLSMPQLSPMLAPKSLARSR
jgi:hypothetical protein